MYTYTIIIPHKNSPQLLQRCLDSIPQRDDLHIIVVDDNSDPDQVDFKHFPGLERPDVEVVLTKEGKGAGYARNVGLEHACCEKVLFADADDYFNYCLGDILDDYKNDTEYDIVFFDRLTVDSYLYTYSNKRDLYKRHFQVYKENQGEGEKLFRYEFNGPVCKIIKKSLIDEYCIRFEETTNQNDVFFAYTTGYYARQIKVDPRAIYTVTYSTSSIMFTMSPEKYKVRVGVYSRKVRFLQEHKIVTRSLRRVQTTLFIVKNECPQIFDDCLRIVQENGLDANYYRQQVADAIVQQERDKKKHARRQRLKNLLRNFARLARC